MPIGRTLIILGLVLIVAGILFTWAPFRIGRLPGDITIRGKNTVFYFPLATSILLSIVLTVVLWLFRR
jgi:hypothetical protein